MLKIVFLSSKYKTETKSKIKEVNQILTGSIFC